MPQTTVRIRPPGGTWEVLGSDQAAGVVPEGLSVSATEAGPDTCSFTLRRDATLPWRDLLPFAEVDVEVAGAGLVWSGRVWDTSYADADTIGVTCRGWQYALDDDLAVRKLYVRQAMDGWRNIREWPTASLTVYGPNLQQNGGTQPAFQLGANVSLPAALAGGRAGIYIDGGHAGAIARVVIVWTSANNTSALNTYESE
ncbi:MAG TPA: hypothetical protein VNT51_05895, partial [Miltoncostaeaceae bacterium]|nr:hypothetical protein [Miltoncostaeaceae bacterium]